MKTYQKLILGTLSLFFFTSCTFFIKDDILLTGDEPLLKNKELSSVNKWDDLLLVGTKKGGIYILENEREKYCFETGKNEVIYKIGGYISEKDTVLLVGIRDNGLHEYHLKNGKLKEIQTFCIKIKPEGKSKEKGVNYSPYSFIPSPTNYKHYLVATSNGLYKTNLYDNELDLIYPTIDDLKKNNDCRYVVHNLVTYENDKIIGSTKDGILCYDCMTGKTNFLPPQIRDVKYVSTYNDFIYALSEDNLYQIKDSISATTPCPLTNSLAHYKVANKNLFFSQLKLVIDKKKEPIPINIENDRIRSFLVKNGSSIYYISSNGLNALTSKEQYTSKVKITNTAVDPTNENIFFLDNFNNKLFTKRKWKGNALLKWLKDRGYSRDVNIIAYNNIVYLTSRNEIFALPVSNDSFFKQAKKILTTDEDIKALCLVKNELLIGTHIRLYCHNLDANNTDTLLTNCNIESFTTADNIALVKPLSPKNKVFCIGDKQKIDTISIENNFSNQYNLSRQYLKSVIYNSYKAYLYLNDSVYFGIDDDGFLSENLITNEGIKTTQLSVPKLSSKGSVKLNDSTLVLAYNNGGVITYNVKTKERTPIYFVDWYKILMNVLIVFFSLLFCFAGIRIIRKKKEKIARLREENDLQKAYHQEINTEIDKLLSLKGFFIECAPQHKEISLVLKKKANLEEKGKISKTFLNELKQLNDKLLCNKNIIEDYWDRINKENDTLKFFGKAEVPLKAEDKYDNDKLKRHLNQLLIKNVPDTINETIDSYIDILSYIETDETKVKIRTLKALRVSIENKNDRLDATKEVKAWIDDYESFSNDLDKIIDKLTSCAEIEGINKGLLNDAVDLKNTPNNLSDKRDELKEINRKIDRLEKQTKPELWKHIEQQIEFIQSVSLKNIQNILVEQLHALQINHKDSFSSLKELKNIELQINQAKILDKILEYKDKDDFTKKEQKEINDLITAFYNNISENDKKIILEILGVKKTTTQHAKVSLILFILYPDINNRKILKVKLDKIFRIGEDAAYVRISEIWTSFKKDKEKINRLDSLLLKETIETYLSKMGFTLFP